MDAKDLRTESSLSERKDGSKYSASGAVQQCNRNKTYQDIGTNPLAKAETAAAVRPCAVIGPDRVLPPPNTNDAYLKKGSIEPWPCPDNIYSQLPDYHHKMSNNPNQMRNISPRQTFQENMQRIMVPPAYNSIKNTTDGSNYNHVQDRAPLSKNLKPNMALEAKYCDVPYTVNQLSNEHKSFRESEISVPSVNSPLMRTIPHGWSPNSGNLLAPRTYGAHEVYQYQQYPNCVGPRPPMLPVGRRHQTFQDDAGYVYPDSYYQDPNIRFKSYPQVKERYPQSRFDYIGNYSNPYHPPPTFPPHKYDIPKPGTAHQYPVYPHLKYIDNRGSEPSIDAYQRSSNQPPPGYNMPFRNQVIHPTYPGIGNAQTKVLPYSVDSTGKPIGSNKLPYDSNKLYIDYDNARNKSYAVNDPYFLNEINRIQPAKNQIMPPNYPTASMHHVPNQQFLRKDIHMKSHEFMPHFRNFDPSIGSYTMIRHPSQFSPNTIAISPTDSTTSNDTTQTQGTNQEDCGYVSQSSSVSARSVESIVNRMSSEYYKRHDYRYGPIGNTHLLSKHEAKGKKQIDVRQFLQMWNEGDDDNGENNNKESIAHASTSNVKQDNKQEQLYVLGLVNVPSEELSKYEHIQTVSKLPEHIKGYNSIELLKQYEEVVESSNINSFKTPVSKKFHMPVRDNRNSPKQIVEVLPRPISPLDVEAKISQSVIHKEVGCNFEIKPCSPKMLNVEIPSSVQNVLGERVIEKVTNPLSKVSESSISVQSDDDSLHNNLKGQTSLSSYDKSSCKILSSPFAPHNLDTDKTDYSIQDLEINSGVCLASLPRLDNEIELNFPEVNQQFIDANKIDNKTSKEICNTVRELNRSKEKTADSEDIERQNINFSQDDSQKEYTRLNNFRKSNSTEHSENTITAVRTDSVIIKNPETLKNCDNSPRYDHSNFISEDTHVPVNLTSYVDVNCRSEKSADSQNSQDKTETYAAIDFSLNKNDVDRANKISKQLKMPTSKQVVNEKNKISTNDCFIDSSSDIKALNKKYRFEESNVETGSYVTTNHKKESNGPSYLSNITTEEIDNLNEYSCKADFEDVMKKLTANDFEMTSEINLDSNNIFTNSSHGIENDINEKDLKVKYDFHHTQFPKSQKSTKSNNHDADIVIKKEKYNEQSIENKKMELKVEEQIERSKQNQKDEKQSSKHNLIKEYSEPTGHKSMELKKIDTDKLTEEDKRVKTKPFTDIENFSITDLTENIQLISTECKKSNIDTTTKGNQSVLLKPQQIENVNHSTDHLTEETENVKAKQVTESENFCTNSLYKKNETKECNTFQLNMLNKEKQTTIPKEHEHLNISKHELNRKEITSFNSNTLTGDDKSIPLKLQKMENKTLRTNVLFGATSEQHNIQEENTLDAETLYEGDQNVLPKQQIRDSAINLLVERDTTIENPLQDNINVDSETLREKEHPQNLQQNLVTATPLVESKIDEVNKKNHSFTPAFSPLEDDTFGNDLLFENDHGIIQEQHLKVADTITNKDDSERTDQNEPNINLLTKMPVELQSVKVNEDNKGVETADVVVERDKIIKLQISTKNYDFDPERLIEPPYVHRKVQYELNKTVKTDTITEEDQSMSHNERSELLTDNGNFGSEMLVNQHNVERNIQLDDQSISQNEKSQPLTKNNNFETEMLVAQQKVDTKMQHEYNQCVKTGGITEKDHSIMSKNEGTQLSQENFGTSTLVNQQNVETKIQHENSKNNVNASTEEDNSIDSVLSMVGEKMDPSDAIQMPCLKNEESLEDCISDNSLTENKNKSVYLLENMPLPVFSSVDSKDSKESSQDNVSDSDNSLTENENNSVYLLENIPLPVCLSVDSKYSRKSSLDYVDRDDKMKHDIDCNFKPICRNNNWCYKIKLYSPQIQKLILHVDGFINSNKNYKQSENILSDKIFGDIETTNVDQESKTDILPNSSENLVEVKTGTEETLERQNTDSKLLPPITSGSKSVVESIIDLPNTLSVINTPKSSQDDSQFEFNEKSDSTENVIIESDSNTNFSTDEGVTSLIDIMKNHKKSNANEQNVIVNDFIVNTECREINANGLSLSDNISANPDSEDVFSETPANVDSESFCCKNETDLRDVKVENESDIDSGLTNRNNTDVTFEKNTTSFVTTHDKSFKMPEFNEGNVYTFVNNIPELRDTNEIKDSSNVKHNSLKRSLSDSALNAYAQDNRELSWPTKRRKIDESTLDHNILNESICRLIQASRRNSVSSFDNGENVSFCILIDDTCILTEGNAQDKICYAEVTETPEGDTLSRIAENLVTSSPFPQNDIDLLTTDTVIYECQEDEVVNEEPWAEDIACIETITCDNVVEELVMSSSPSPKHGYNDTVISENVAEDVVISSPSSIKCFEDDFVNVAPTFNHDWVETLVDDGVAEDVVISSFLTAKEDCLESEIRTNIEETIANSPSKLKGDWNETVDEDVGVGSVLTHRESWDETLVDVNVTDDVVANSSSSQNYDCLEVREKETKEKNVLITSSPINYVTESEVNENVIRNTMDSTTKHNHSFKRVVKVTDVMITDSPSYSKDHLDYEDNELSCYNFHEHANKVKSIYGETMTDGDAQIVDTLFRTPQMDVNKTLLHDPLELDISAKLSHMEYSDDSSSETAHQKSSSCIFAEYSDCKYNNSDISNHNTYQKENIVALKSTSHSNDCNDSSETDNSFSAKCIPQDNCVDNVITNDDSNYISSSPEVSSTTSEERNSGILLKITNLNGSRISQINEIKSDRKPRCKFTEKKDYSINRFPNRPLITKAAQKYIPPVQESIRDLKVKISLPPQSLLKFKELKLSRNIKKVTNKQNSNNIQKNPKKPKPLFEDVLKSIDEIQIKMHREKKKPKTTVPKVVIKKNEYGSHYASTPTKETFNPDLTGRKWQPWVFMERNSFIDKMALKNKTRAVFSHRKKCYVLAEKFKKYKSAVSNTKFVISRPSSVKSTGQLKYTIRLKHSY